MSKNDKLCHLVPQTLSFFDLTMSFFDFAIAERQSCDLRCKHGSDHQKLDLLVILEYT